MARYSLNNSSIHVHPTYNETICQDMSNPCPWTFRPRIRLMNFQRSPLNLKADLPVGVNSSYICNPFNTYCWMSIYYHKVVKLTSVTIHIYNYFAALSFDGSKWSYGMYMFKLIRCYTPTWLLIWYNGDTHNQVITINILHFNEIPFACS